MPEVMYLFLLFGLVLCLSGLQTGMLVTIFAGCLQDIFRKLDPGSSLFLTALVLIFVGTTLIAAAGAGKLLPLRTVPGWNALLKQPFFLFAYWVVFESIATVLYTGSLIVAGIGLVVYLAPVPALLLGFSFALNVDRILAFIWTYVALSAVMTSGVYLSYLGFDWDILQSVGTPLIVYSLSTGLPIELPSGFFRQPEVAAWHAGAGACFSLLLGLCKGKPAKSFVCFALALFFFGGVMLTGRRKFLVEIIVYLPLLWILLWHFRAYPSRALMAMAVAGLISVVVLGVIDPQFLTTLQDASLRGEVREGEIYERIVSLGFVSLYYVFIDNGFFGSGAGMGSGGAQQYVGDDAVGWAGEGGLGKIMAELGIPGLAIFTWLIYKVAISLWRIFQMISGGEFKGDSVMVLVTMALFAFLVANGAVFIGAHQVYSDPFILWLLGTCIGFIYALGKIAEDKILGDKLAVQQGRTSIARQYAVSSAT